MVITRSTTRRHAFSLSVSDFFFGLENGWLRVLSVKDISTVECNYLYLSFVANFLLWFMRFILNIILSVERGHINYHLLLQRHNVFWY